MHKITDNLNINSMKTQKELLREIESLQGELQTITTLCEFIPEKLAVHFKPAYLRSGYSMGETIVYTCNGKTIITQNECKHYTGTGRKYTPTHGLIKIDFTKKALTAYCRTLKEMGSLEWFNKLAKNTRNEIQQELRFTRENNKNTEDLEKELAKVQDLISKRFEEFCELGGELKKLLLLHINYKKSKIKDLVCTAF